MRERIGFIGFGRFGRALAALLVEAGHEVRAHDPHGVPEGFAAPSIEDLLRDSDVVFLAVPVPLTGVVLHEIRPHLRTDQLVLDVGSVKSGPEHAFREVLGADIPWAATHPLFGPASRARGERPLEVVVCPNPLHPVAVERATRLYESIGGHVHEQTAEVHDRAMASTHVLAFFIAKGLLDIGAGEGVPFAPPSFQAVARTVEAVRADAGHLFLAIQQENEYAARMRRQLIDALQNIDEQLDIVVDTGDLEPPPMSIPGLGVQSPVLKETRELIDDVDRELVALLGRRAQLSKRAGAAKASVGHKAVRDPERERALLESRMSWADAHGLRPDAVKDLFEVIMMHSRKVQRD